MAVVTRTAWDALILTMQPPFGSETRSHCIGRSARPMPSSSCPLSSREMERVAVNMMSLLRHRGELLDNMEADSARRRRAPYTRGATAIATSPVEIDRFQCTDRRAVCITTSRA